MLNRFPELVLGVLLAVALFGMGMLFSSHPPQNAQQQHATESAKHVGAPSTAEERIADYTLALAWLTAILAVSTVGLWAITWLDLRHSRKSAQDQLRPYVNVAGATYEWGGSGFRFVVECLNSGQTPATFFEVGGMSVVRVDGSKDEWIVPPNLKCVRWVSLGAGSRETVGIQDVEFPNLAREVLESQGKKVFFLVGRVRYGDVFRNEYESEFVFFSKILRINEVVKMSRASGDLKTYHQTKTT